MPRPFRPLACFVVAALAVSPALAHAEESWDAIFVQGQRIGYLHVRVEPVQDKAGKPLVRIRVDWNLNFKRDKDTVKITQQWGTIEKQDGTILRLDVRTQASGQDLRTFGDVKDGVMKLTVDGGGAKQTLNIPWGDDIRGPYGAELSLAREKMKPGQTREIKIFVPDLNKVCLSKLEAGEFEKIPLGPKNELRELLKLTQTVSELDGTPKPEMTATLWVDASGQILKTHSEMLSGTDFYRTTRAGALEGDGRAEFNLLAASIIKCRDLPNSEKLRNVTYTVSAPGEALDKLFPVDARQSLVVAPAGEPATLQVKTAGPMDGKAVDPPGDEFMQPNTLINSDDGRVHQHVAKAIKGVPNDPWQQAVAIQKWVSKNLTEKNFKVAFAPAKQVARDLAGDCSEHSVLTAAMCRAAGIPARCVIGIAYVGKIGGFGPHMWNEVYVNNRWVAIDAAFDQSEVDATHIKLSTSSLDGVSPFETFTPILKVFGGMKIDPKEIR